MTDSGAAKPVTIKVVDMQQREDERVESKEIEQHDLSQGLEKEEDQRIDERVVSERNEMQDLNQGTDTGTHGSIRHGVKWGASYQMRNSTSPKIEKKDDTDKSSS